MSKYNDVKMLEEKGLNHDAYLVCGVDNCHLKISKMHKIGSISNQYYRDLFDYEKQNIILLENNELDGDHFSNTMMGMYLER